MLDLFIQLSLFTAKAFISLAVILLLFSGILAIATRSKAKLFGRITIKNLNQKYAETKEDLLREVSSKKSFKSSTPAFSKNESMKWA